MRKKFKRGTTEVEGLSYTKDGRRFKASQIDRDGKCSYKTICEAIDRNKARTQIPSAAPKPQLRPVKTIQNIAAKTADSVAEIAADMAGGLGNIVNIGPGFDPQEEEFIREMQRRKKKKKGIRL